VSKYQITVNGKTFTVEVGDVSSPTVEVTVDGVPKTVTYTEMAQAAPAQQSTASPAARPSEARPTAPTVQTAPAASVAGQVVKAPMPGKIMSISVALGDAVSVGDTVCTLEAMKMEMPIASTAAGSVKAIHAQIGENVSHDAPLVTLG